MTKILWITFLATAVACFFSRHIPWINETVLVLIGTASGTALYARWIIPDGWRDNPFIWQRRADPVAMDFDEPESM